MSERTTAEIIAELRTPTARTIEMVNRGEYNVTALAEAAATRLEELDVHAELLAAALFVRGVQAKDCDALDQWCRR